MSSMAHLAVSNIEEYTVVVLGWGGVGKSAFITQFVEHDFQETHDPTREDVGQRQLMVGKQPCIISIAEGSGAAWNTSQLTDLIINADAAVILYSATSKASLTAAHELWKGAKVTKEEMGMWEIFQITLLGNKTDLEGEREVSKEEGEACAKSMGCSFREGSAKTGMNIDQSVEELVKKIRTYRDNERIRYERIRKETDKKKGKISMPWKKLFSK